MGSARQIEGRRPGSVRTHALVFSVVATSLGTVSCGAAAPVAQKAVAQAPARATTAPPFPVTRAAPDKGDRPVPAGLAALRSELDRAVATLGKADPPVHNLTYTVTLHEDEQLSAAYGAIEGEGHHEQRSLDVDLRVGAAAFDSSHSSRRIAPVRGHWDSLPLDDTDPLAARQVAWNATDRAYKDAVERFVSLKNQREVQAEDEDKSADFSTEAPARYIGEPAPPLGIDVVAWKPRLRALSAKFEGEKDIHESHVALSASRRTRWFLSSEGTMVQYGTRAYRLVVTASTQADDGMPLGLFKSFEAWTPAGLPNDAAVEASIAEMTTNLKALRRAPLAEPFTGPAILEGRAAGVFFHEVIGHRLEAHRLRSDGDGQTFGKKLDQQVMPAFLSLYDDPTLVSLGDTELNGYYLFDDEGVLAQRAPLIDNGVLKGFLFGRTPARGFVHSNGHGRRQEGRPLVARQGNLVLEPSETVPVATLRARLVAEAKAQGRAYGLRFVDIQGGFTDTSRFGTQGFKVMPTLVYRVYVDGRPDELIRGVDIVGTPLAMLMRIEAAGDDHGIFNGVCGAESGWVPVSATSPSLLIGQIETALKDKGNSRPPVLEAPAISEEAP
jgi:predicted Zn-dependent protease